MSQGWDRRRVAGTVLRGLLTVVFLVAAGMKFAAVPFELEGFARFGYPLWFMYGVGVLQLLGAALLWTRGCVVLGAGLLAVLMVGAVGSHLSAGDPILMPLPALGLLTLLTSVAYVRRSEIIQPKFQAELHRA